MTSYWNRINEKLYGSEGNLDQRQVTWKPPKYSKYGSQQQLSSSGDSLNRMPSGGKPAAWGTSKQILSKKRLSGSVGCINIPEGSGSTGGQSSQGRPYTSTGDLNGSLSSERQQQQQHYSTSVLLSRQNSQEEDFRVSGEDLHSIQRAGYFASSEQERPYERSEERRAMQSDELQISHLRQDEYGRHSSRTEELHNTLHLSSFSRHNSQERLDFATEKSYSTQNGEESSQGAARKTQLTEQERSPDQFVQEQSPASPDGHTSDQTSRLPARSTESHSGHRNQQVSGPSLLQAVHTARPAFIMLADSPDHSTGPEGHNHHSGTQGGSERGKRVMHRAMLVSVTDDEDDDDDDEEQEEEADVAVFSQEQDKSQVPALEKEDKKEDHEEAEDPERDQDHARDQDHKRDPGHKKDQGHAGTQGEDVSTLRREVKRITKLKEEIEENLIKTQAELKREVQELTERLQKEELRWKREKTTRDAIIVNQKGRLEALTEERDQLQGQLSAGKQEASGQERVKELEKQLQQEQQRHDEQLTMKEREVTSLKAELKERDREVTKSQSQAIVQEKLTQAQDHLRQEQDLHQAQVTRKERDIASLRTQLQERDTELSRRQEQAKVKEKLEQLVRQLEDQVKQLKDQVKQREDQVKQREDQVKHLEEQVKQLKDQVKQREDQVKQLKDQVKQREDQVKHLEDQVKQQVRQLRQEQQRHQEQLAKKEQEISSLKTQLQERCRELTRFQAQAAAPASPRQKTCYDPQQARVHKQIEELQEQLRQEQRHLREQLAKKEGEVSSLRTQLQERDKELARHQAQVMPSVPPLQSVSALGLPNLGNTSYMNCVVQCLFNINTLRQYFIQEHYKPDVNTSSEQGGQVALALAGVFSAMESGSGIYDAMRHFKTVVEGQDKVFKLHRHPKAHDLLASLLAWLHNDLTQMKSIQQALIQHSPVSSVVSRTFHGIKESLIFCPEKKRIASIANECFDNLTLTVLGGEERPLLELLKSHLRPQEIDWDCQHCRRRHKCFHYSSLNKLPQVLALHFNRHHGSTAGVNFPAGNLTLDAVVDGRAQYSATYELVSVCVQQQGTEGSSNHYTAFCRSREGRRWWLWDDTHLHPARLDNVLATRHPHLVFYEAVKD